MKTPEQKSGVFLWAEFLLLFIGTPLVLLVFRQPGLLFLALWGGGFVTYRLSRPLEPAPLPDLRTILRRVALLAPLRIGLALMLVTAKPRGQERQRRGETRRILDRFLLLGLLLTIMTRMAMPGQFLDLPRQRPVLWLAIMLLYPLLSVWPQEVIYRRFFFARYAPIFGEGAGLIAASALSFGFAHVLFLNWIAVAMTAVGGAIFAADYARHRSLRLACLEHSLYGCLIFTIGLGRFFYTGTAWHH
jgi:membrane protease YdiL (CAAX protease family)